MKDLALIPTEVLIDELKSRCDNFIAVLKFNLDEDDCTYIWHYSGTIDECVGLCERMKLYIHNCPTHAEEEDLG